MNDYITIERFSKDKLDSLDVFDWPTWQKHVCEFDWEYDSDEQCYIIEGIAEIDIPKGKMTIKKGDFVTFKKGLKCKWSVIEPIKKHYNFL